MPASAPSGCVPFFFEGKQGYVIEEDNHLTPEFLALRKTPTLGWLFCIDKVFYLNRFSSSASVNRERIVFPSGVKLESGLEKSAAIR